MDKKAISGKLGNIAFSIVAEVRDGKQQDANRLAIASVAYRAGASKLFPSNGKGHKREEPFSEALAKDADTALREALGELFNVQSVELSAYVATESGTTAKAREQMRVSLVGLGLSNEDIAKAVDKAFPTKVAAPVVEAPTSEVVSVS